MSRSLGLGTPETVPLWSQPKWLCWADPALGTAGGAGVVRDLPRLDPEITRIWHKFMESFRCEYFYSERLQWCSSPRRLATVVWSRGSVPFSGLWVTRANQKRLPWSVFGLKSWMLNPNKGLHSHRPFTEQWLRDRLGPGTWGPLL